MYERIAAVVPAFNPDPILVGLCAELRQVFGLVLVVDDGSVVNREVLADLPSSVTVIGHRVNKGKGRAIKTALKWIQDNRPDAEGVVFIDADGQHRVADVKRVAQRLADTGLVTLGVRNFTGPSVPFRSRLGNAMTSRLVRLMLRFKVSDTQTGLRGIPSRLFSKLQDIPGDRYEYEMRLFVMLKDCHEGLAQVRIETVYDPGNKTSHFRPVSDSLLVIGALFGDGFEGLFLKFSLSGLFGFAVDNIVFTGALFALQAQDLPRRHAIMLSLLLARTTSFVVNYRCNRSFVFESSRPAASTFLRYTCLAAALGALSYAGTAVGAFLLDAHGFKVTAVKVVLELALFALSYLLQRKWVFK